MSTRATLTAVTAGWAVSLAAARMRFERAARQPERTQLARLRELVSANAPTAYGRAHGFEQIHSVDAWRSKVPIVRYQELAPWIERVAAGESSVLTRAPVLLFEETSGSTSERKLVPVTAAARSELSGATGPWLFDLFRQRPGLVGTSSYWSISPAARARSLTAGGIPIGIEDDTEYFGAAARWALRKMLSVPPEVARIEDVDRWRQETIDHLIVDGSLGLISVWSPTFLAVLMERIERDLPACLDKIAAYSSPRAAQVRLRLADGKGLGEALWPRLQVLSSWADGHSARLVGRLSRWFPTTPLQAKGLLATEGVVSFPLWGAADQPNLGNGSVLAVGSHFLEFIDLEHEGAAPLLAHELQVGGAYSPLLSTGAGLYRYQLSDRVECVGLYRRTPIIRFVGKLDRTSDLCGEKLDAAHVERSLAVARARTGVTHDFALVAPGGGGGGENLQHYVLYIETPHADAELQGFAQVVETELQRAFHYQYARDLGQLGALAVTRVRGGTGTFERRLVGEGVRLGDIKPSPLDGRLDWASWFSGPTRP